MKLTDILHVDACKNRIAKTRPDEICILCGHYSIYIAGQYTDAEELQSDLDELSDILGQYLYVSDYDDLCCDPHGLTSND